MSELNISPEAQDVVALIVKRFKVALMDGTLVDGSDAALTAFENSMLTDAQLAINTSTEALEKRVKELEHWQEHAAESDKEFCQIEDWLIGNKEINLKTGLIDRAVKCKERIRDLIAKEGELGDLKDSYEQHVGALRIAVSERDKLAKELELIKQDCVDEQSLGGLEIVYNKYDNRFYAHNGGRVVWSGLAKFNVWQCVKLEKENAELREKLNTASVPICIGEPIISILAKHGQWVSEDGRGVIAASDLFQHNPYDERDQLQARVVELEDDKAELITRLNLRRDELREITDQYSEHVRSGNYQPIWEAIEAVAALNPTQSK